jgi:MazG family protein
MTDEIDPATRVAELLGIMAALRTPVTGCPWDLEQTFRTIAPYTIEEAYEVADAIEKRDLDGIKEELGDLLLQVVYHARIAEEDGAFDFGDVVQAINAKMIRRHPHVFGTEAEKTAGASPGFWERLKAEERAGKPKQPESVLDGVPVALPALTRAIKLQNKAACVGFDWPSLAPVLDKLKEELAELEHEIKGGTAAREAMEEELGDLMFVVANVARHLKLDPEAALRAANQKFIRRFQVVEQRLAALGRSPAESTLEEMDRLWDAAKLDERSSAKGR